MKNRFFVITKFTTKIITAIMIIIIFIIIGMFKIYKLANEKEEVILEIPKQEISQKKGLKVN